MPENDNTVIIEAERHNQQVKLQLLSTLKGMDPRNFESLVGRLLSRIGFVDVEVTPYSGDGGIDVKALLSVGGVTSVRTAIQVKRYAQNVSGKVVRELRGSIGIHERGLIITTAGFTSDAISQANDPDKAPISLVDGEQLVELLIEHGLGVNTNQVSVLQLDMGSLGEDSQPDEDAYITEGDGLEEDEIAYSTGNGRKPQYLSAPLWPGKNPIQTLNQIMEFIADQEPTMDEIAAWMLGNFPAYQVWNQVPRRIARLGLIAKQGFRYHLTDKGVTFRESHYSLGYLQELLFERIVGFRELLAVLHDSPGKLERVYPALKEQLGVSWNTPRQTELRLKWLECLNLAERDGNGVWRLKG